MIEAYLTNSDLLLVSFGGLALRVGMPIPEFRKTVSSIKANKLFFMDKYRCWYFRIFEETIDSLQNWINKLNPKKTIFYGCSAGGYASIMFGVELEVDLILAFQTQTFLSHEERKKNNDQRWKDEIKDVYKYSKRNLDLWNYDKKCKTLIELFYCKNFHHSRIHAELFLEKTNLLNLKMNPYECESYPLARNLKNKGDLSKIFQNRIGEINGC